MSHQHPDERPTVADRVYGGVAGTAGAGAAAIRRAGRALRHSAAGVGSATAATRARLAPAWDRLGAAAGPPARRVAPALGAVTPLGRGVAAAGVAAWVAGSLLGWVEWVTLGVTCVLLFAVACVFTIGRTRLEVTLELTPGRVVAGNSAAGRVLARNTARRRLLPAALEVPIGVSRARFEMPGLAPGAHSEELFVVSTTRRGVIPVGPASTVRGDPIGLLRRVAGWTQVIELCVHPITVPLEPLGAGLLRDLEGTTTNEMSMSDLAFHTLREYSPGDDRRYIHWRSSARVGSVTQGGKFLVRQFLDTRRSHLTVVVDGRPASYLDPVDFETAISAAASITARAIGDDMATTVLAAQHAVHESNIQLTMDGFARAEPGGDRLAALAARAVRLAPDTSVALLVTGVATPFAELQRAAAHFAPEVQVVAIQVDPTANAGIAVAGGLTLLSLPQLATLSALLAGAGA